ncbi:ATP-binding cassette permease MDL2 NDAI_0I02730 [Naumovozyma dairenensis CBS 421]|uniref:ATP-dependent permease MDL2, mitochondrial n=1 Tax=Naumovozyma dairenensis (strain ATCC 10597 / BCRC 20456 / CBS 421 / NBRC 0211 / NRRL Y-12639) TaxID=1071378 RepID=G0WGD0_NAUDC|nr:hypothetical protein NDAI_0I02730 [Naumovozyma dairenensis CBS 421]CCD26841.1 hypothetical protein NDAI_0I02730 [Naumovozyma dairenensis CBS 421]
MIKNIFPLSIPQTISPFSKPNLAVRTYSILTSNQFNNAKWMYNDLLISKGDHISCRQGSRYDRDISKTNLSRNLSISTQKSQYHTNHSILSRLSILSLTAKQDSILLLKTKPFNCNKVALRFNSTTNTTDTIPPHTESTESTKASTEPNEIEPDQGESNFKDVFRLFLLVKKDYKLLIVSLTLLTISCTIGMMIPKIIGLILDALKSVATTPDGGSSPPPTIMFGLTLYEFLGGFSVALFIGCAANYGRLILLRILSERLVARLRSVVMKHTLHQDSEFFDVHKVGDLISRLGADSYIVSRSITQKISDGVKSLICGGVGIGMMLELSMDLSSVLVCFVIPVVLSASIFGKQIRINSRELQDATGQLTRVSEEQLNGVRTVQSFVAEQREIKRFNHSIREIFDVGKRAAFINAKFFTSTSLVGDLSFLTVLVYGSYLVLHGSLTIGDLTAFMLYTEYTGNAIFGLSTFYSEIMQGAGAASRLFELTDRVPTIRPTLGKTYTPGKGEIEFKNVSFAYPTRPSNQIFKSLNFKIKPGSNVCIVGPSGKGKSTIALLLLHYYNPTSGQILIDGQDITKLNSKSLRRQIAVVQQEPVLMSGTIRDNITYGLTEEPTKEEIRTVAKQCFCHNFIVKFPYTYDTYIGPHGTLLSGGQKQRIAIARALIKKPNILILDEATSALDVESEGAINYTFGQLMKSKSMTIVSIAHRLSTIRRSENIIVLGNDGSVVEMGKFKELFADPTSELSKLLNEKSSRKKVVTKTVPPVSSTSVSSANGSSIHHEGTILEEDHAQEDHESEAPPTIITTQQLEDSIESVLNDVSAESKPIKLSPKDPL